jgi:hypothetical protein
MTRNFSIIATDALHAAREKSVEIVGMYNNVSSAPTLMVCPRRKAPLPGGRSRSARLSLPYRA